MNYLLELKAFYDRLELNPLPSPAIALWHALMSIANKTGWQQEFTVAVSVLMLKSGLNAQAIKRARNRLEQDGYIVWKSRVGNQSAVYHMNSLMNIPVAQNDIRNVPQSEPQSEPQSVPQSVPINKQDINKTDLIPPTPRIDRFEEFQSAYPKKGSRYLIETEYCNAIMAGVLEVDLVKAAKNYAGYCQREKKKEQFIKNPENFLRENVFMEYLKGDSSGESDRDFRPHEKSINEVLCERGCTEFAGF